jgi:hypothetical protein
LRLQRRKAVLAVAAVDQASVAWQARAVLELSAAVEAAAVQTLTPLPLALVALEDRALSL